MSDDEVGGGQIWKQDRFPYMVRYITLLGDGKMATLSDPREEGSTVCTTEDGTWQWNASELYERLVRLGYTCCGQLHDLIDEEQERLYMEALEEAP